MTIPARPAKSLRGGFGLEPGASSIFHIAGRTNGKSSGSYSEDSGFNSCTCVQLRCHEAT